MQSLQAEKCSLLAAQLLALMTQVAQGSESRAIALAAELDLSLSQLRALLVLWRAEEPVSLGALAQGVGLSDAAAVRMVDGLLRSDLVARREDSHDRRIKRITLSAAGVEAVQGLVAAKREGLERLAQALLPDELEQLTAALEPIVARLGLPLELPVGR
jgi:DNA-binding MarR family transcriptional regulator